MCARERGGWWAGPGGVREVLVVGSPLILSHMSFTLQTFVDRLLLTWYSAEAVAGAVTAVIATWAFLGAFIGTGEYLTSFVAQYYGAGRRERIGPALWQGVYFALAAGLAAAALLPAARPFFERAGHAPAIQEAEVTYARILLLGAFPTVLMATLSTFFAGRGQTGVILRVNLLVTALNAVLDYLWIFGRAGFPRWGVAGAAWATVTAQAFGALLYVFVLTRPAFRAEYRTLSGWRFEPGLFLRLLRFGLPTGLQYSLEILAFALFMLVVGRLGTVALAGSSVALTLNNIVFIPMLGFGIGVSGMVGRYLGANRADRAERSVRSAFAISLAYMTTCGALYLLAPGILLAPFAAGAHPTTFAAVADLCVVLLRFVAVYSIFDMMNVIFAAGLKGAGDTTYPLVATVVLSWILMLGPTWVGVAFLGRGVVFAWSTAALYVVALGLLMHRRFRSGHWKSLRVIEKAPAVPDAVRA
jgi:MATE family multidrug resistance protein